VGEKKRRKKSNVLKTIGSILLVVFAYALGFLTAHYLYIAKQMNWLDWVLVVIKFGIFAYFIYLAYTHIEAGIHLSAYAETEIGDRKKEHLIQARYLFWQGIAYLIVGLLVLIMVR